MSLLIIGGDSRLSKRIRENYVVKYSTSRTLHKRNKLFLDLSDTDSFEIPEDVDKCLIIGGPVSYAQANTSSTTVRDIHQFQIPLLVKRLLTKNIYTVYISSNMVLGKDCKDRSEKAIPNPNIEYGKIKYICEKKIYEKATEVKNVDKLAIFRMTKNISPETTPFLNWIKNYKNDEPIIAFKDLYFSPLFYEKSADALIRLANLEAPGIFHFSGLKDINYYELCREVNKVLIKKNKKQIKIIDSTSKEQGITLEDIGSTTFLDMKRTSSMLKIKPVKLSEICDYIISLLD